MFTLALMPFTDWVYLVVYTIYAITILGTIVIVITENRNPVKSLAWVIVLTFLPVVGLVFYIFFGQNFKAKRMVSRRIKRKLRKRDYHSIVNIDELPLNEESKQEIKLCHSLCSMPYYSGNRVKIFTTGQSKFDQYLQDLEAAREYIHIQYYIFEDDKLGSRVKEVLLRCARRGVQIRVLYDDVGCWSVKKRFFKEMQEAGIVVRPFLEITFPQLASRINYRNHRKITIIDGHIGYIGGMNIADRYIEGLKWGIWRDTHLRIEGPAVQGLQLLFAVDWSFECKEVLSAPHFFPPIEDRGESGIQIAPGGPIGEWSNIAMLFLKAITNAKKAVYIQTPYFLPTDSLAKALQTAALAKVDVRVMIGSEGLLLPTGTAPCQDRHYRRRTLHGGVDQLRLPQLRTQLRGQRLHLRPRGQQRDEAHFHRRPAALPAHHPALLASPPVVAKGAGVDHAAVEPGIIAVVPETVRSH